MEFCVNTAPNPGGIDIAELSRILGSRITFSRMVRWASYQSDGDRDHLEVFAPMRTALSLPGTSRSRRRRPHGVVGAGATMKTSANGLQTCSKAGCDIPYVQMANPTNDRRGIKQLAKALDG